MTARVLLCALALAALLPANVMAQTSGVTSPGTNIVGVNTNSLERLRIDANGNVGIGTASPNTPLHVTGNVTLTSGSIGVNRNPNDGSVPSGGNSANPRYQISNGTSYFGIESYNSSGTNTGVLSILGASGNVGVGTASPSYKLDVSGTTRLAGATSIGAAGISGRTLEVTPNSSDGITIGQVADNSHTIQTYIDGQWANRTTYAGGCCNALNINTDVGQVVIGNTAGGNSVTLQGSVTASGTMRVNGFEFLNASPTIGFGDTDHQSAYIHVNSNLFYILRGCGTGLSSWCVTGNDWPMYISMGDNQAYFGSNVQAYGFYIRSDARLKKDVIPFEREPFAIMKGLTPVHFTWITTKERDFGIIAQEVEKVIPEVVHEDLKGNKTVAYDKLVLPVIAAVKKLIDGADDQATQLRELQAWRAEAAARISALEAANAALRKTNASLRQGEGL